jgi:hypothetical protein
MNWCVSRSFRRRSRFDDARGGRTDDFHLLIGSNRQELYPVGPVVSWSEEVLAVNGFAAAVFDVVYVVWCIGGPEHDVRDLVQHQARRASYAEANSRSYALLQREIPLGNADRDNVDSWMQSCFSRRHPSVVGVDPSHYAHVFPNALHVSS